jgi:hypothetical protein
MTAAEILKALESEISDQEIVGKIQIYRRCVKDAVLAGDDRTALSFATKLEHLYTKFGTRIDNYITSKVG